MLLHPQECQLLLATIWNQRESWRWVFTTASQRVNPAHIIILDFWSLELWQNSFLLFQPPQPGSSLSQEWGETHLGRSCFVLLQVMVNVTKTWYPHKKKEIETQTGRMYVKTQAETGMVDPRGGHGLLAASRNWKGRRSHPESCEGEHSLAGTDFGLRTFKASASSLALRTLPQQP